MPGAKSKHTAKWDRCVKKVEDKSPNANPYAICSSSIDDAGLKKSHQKRSKDSYYANRKKAARKESKKESLIIKFSEFINEHYDEYSEEEGARINQEKENDQYYIKAKELIDMFVNEHDPNKYDLDFIKSWLKDNNEPEEFAEIIHDELKNL